MSNVHIKHIEDSNGDLVDLEYFHHSCSPPDVLDWPAPEAVDYPVYCAGCEKRIDEVPLTEEGKHEAAVWEFPSEFWMYDSLTKKNHAFIPVSGGRDALCTFRKDEPLTDEDKTKERCSSCLQQIIVLKTMGDFHASENE